MLRPTLLPCLVASMGLLPACSPAEVPRTEVVVAIDADDAIRDAAADVRVVVRSATSRDSTAWMMRFEQSTGGSGDVAWPVLFVIEPEGGNASRVFDVVVEAIDGGGDAIARERLSTGFVEGETRVHPIFLDSACAGDAIGCVDEACRGADCETCSEGKCVAAWVEPSEGLPYSSGQDLATLPEFSPRVADSGMPDAQIDPDTPCPGGCAPGQICDVEAERPACVCDAGFQDHDGDGTCERTCASVILGCNPLSQECDDSTGTPLCVCVRGYQDNDGDGDCLRTCAQAQLGCDGATERCDDSSGEAQCVCAPTYQDMDGDGVCHLDCENRLPRCAEDSQQCIYGDDGVTQCACADGYQDNDGDGQCEWDCAAAALACDEPSQRCDDSSGTAMCVCAADYQDNDGDMVCRAACGAFGPANCDPITQVCQDADGSAACACAADYQDNDGDGDCSEACSILGATCDASTEVCDDAGGTAACVCGPDYQDNDGDQVCTQACSTFEPANCDGPTQLCDDADGTARCQCRPSFEAPECRWCAEGYQDRDLDAACEPGCGLANLACVQGQRCDESSGSASCIVLRDCSAIRQRDPAAVDGVYTIDPDGPGGRDPIDAYCDMTTAGGGFTLVLNYVHQGGSDPALSPSDSRLPLLGGQVLGDDGSQPGDEAFWGHASSALLSELAPTELRFEGRSSGPGGDVHFSTSHPGCLHHARVGSQGTGCKGAQQAFTPLAGHTATLPAAADTFGLGGAPLTDGTFASATARWSIGSAGRWEVDEVQPGGQESALDTIHRVWVRRLPRDCADIQLLQPDAPDGTYLVDPDGPGAQPPIEVACDMTTDGGGWTLVLNYVHQGGTQPAVNVRSSDLPLLGAGVLGDDESGTASWGHAGAAMLARLAPDELRFEATSSGGGRMVHFRTGHAGCIAYLSTGTGDCEGVQQDHVVLPGHDGQLPASADGFGADMGDAAMLEQPFFEAGVGSWSIARGGNSWEVDDVDVGSGDADTVHRVWVRRFGRNCSELRRSHPRAPDGTYRIDPDGPGGQAPMDAYCDMTTAGGGWTLVLNYVHRGGDDPPLSVRTDSLPVLSAAGLGDDDRPEAFGHAGNALFSVLGGSQLRFFAETSNHGRRLHFHTPRCLSYFATGQGDCFGIQDGFTLLPRHSSFALPDQADSFEADRGDLAMTHRPFHVGGLNSWGVGVSGAWEVDDVGGGAGNDTVHRIWVRQAASCLELQQLDPATATGFHTIDPDGVGPLPSRRVYCDMDFDGGGWTLTMATLGGRPDILFEVEVDPASPGRMPAAELQALASRASQLHVRTPAMADVASITSTPGSAPIHNVAAGLRANASPNICAPDDPVVDWGGPLAAAPRLYSDCAAMPQPDEGYPGIFWAHGNPTGMTLADVASSWDISITSSEPMEVYLR